MKKKETIKSVTFILSGALPQIFNGIGGNFAATDRNIRTGAVFYGLKKLQRSG
ncbi:MAG: hypothetical protein R2727_08520 [Bacteroidales bacterium]